MILRSPEREVLNFNSIKVRLEQPDNASLHIALPNFNSIKVRLEHNKAGSCLCTFKFQFHKGTIRTGQMKQRMLMTTVFQFHKGTIRT